MCIAKNFLSRIPIRLFYSSLAVFLDIDLMHHLSQTLHLWNGQIYSTIIETFLLYNGRLLEGSACLLATFFFLTWSRLLGSDTKSSTLWRWLRLLFYGRWRLSSCRFLAFAGTSLQISFKVFRSWKFAKYLFVTNFLLLFSNWLYNRLYNRVHRISFCQTK